MLGLSSKISRFKTADDFTCSADYLNYLFSDCRGLLYRVTLNPFYHQTFYRTSGAEKAEFDNVKNCYISMNTFFRTSNLSLQEGRDSAHLKRLSSLYVDIDCYKLGLSKQEVLFELQDNYFGSIIPHPTFIVDSGRGLYLIWKLRNEDRNALPRWSAVQKFLTEALQKFGSDSACVDSSRILRVPFSINSKSNSVVSILEFNDFTYSIYDIMREYEIEISPKRKRFISLKEKKYPYNHATEKQRKYVEDIARRLNIDKALYPDFTSFSETDAWIKLHKNTPSTHREEKDGYMYKKGSAYFLDKYKLVKNLLIGYCKDIKTLFTLRKGSDCKREIGLFLYRYFLRELKHDSKAALEKTLALNASLDVPFDEEYVIKATAHADRRVDSGVPYLYKKSTLIKVLEITKKELTFLPSFTSYLESFKERKKERNRKAYEKKLSSAGKICKKEALLERRYMVYLYKKEELSSKEIMQKLKISRATYNRDIASLNSSEVMEYINKKNSQNKKCVSLNKRKKSTSPKKLSRVFRFICVTVETGNIFPCLWLSHFFSSPFIIKYTYGVPHGVVVLHVIVEWINLIKSGTRSDESY